MDVDVVVATDGVTDDTDGVDGGVWMPAIGPPRHPFGEPDDDIGDGILYLQEERANSGLFKTFTFLVSNGSLIENA